jgi:YggT family protein
MRATAPPLGCPCSSHAARVDQVHHWLRRAERMRAILDIVLIVIQIYIYIVIAAAVFSWLVAFNVVNMRNQLVGTIGEFLYRATEPALGPIRRFMPNLGGLDISPIILWLILIFVRLVILYYIYPYVF